MKIRKLSIYNYRGISKLESLEITNLNVFVGKNDSGKSIILRALDCFFDEKNFTIKDIFKGKSTDEDTIIEISFEPELPVDYLALSSEGFIVLRKIFHFEKDKIKVSAFYLSNDYVNEEYQDLWNKKESELNALINKIGGDSKRSGRGNKNVERIDSLKKLLESEERKDSYHNLGDFLGNLKKAYEIELPGYSLFGADEELDITATNFQSQFKALVSSSLEKCQEKTDSVKASIEQDLAAEFQEIKLLMNKNVPGLAELKPELECDWKKAIKFDLGMKFEGENYNVPLSHKGTGFRRLLMVAYFEYLVSKKKLKNQIFAIEEPETYLHPSAQSDLLSSIIVLAHNSQFFLTTHSPIFAGASDGEYSVLVTKNCSGLSEYNRGSGIIQRIIDEIGIHADYNLLKNIKFIVFVEGPDDIHFLKAVAKTMYGKELEQDGIICLIGGGSTLKNYAELDLFNKVIPGRTDKYAVLVDGDNGDRTKEKAIEMVKCRCETDKAIFHRLARREIENYCCPQKIKEHYLSEIFAKEGSTSQSPHIQRINELDINIQDTTDVERLLQEKGLNSFKSGRNVKVFGIMTKKDWEAADSNQEIADFLQSIYTRIQSK